MARLTHELETAKSFKVRLHAAGLLARAPDPRVAPALGRALGKDRDDLVRAFVAQRLGQNPGRDEGGRVARLALSRATQDKSPKVRKAAQAALLALERAVAAKARAAPTAGNAELAPQPTRLASMKIVVGQFADRSGRASPLLREQVRRNVMQQLKTQRRVVVVDRMGADVSYVVEGNIKRLSLSPLRSDMEATCAIDLMLSHPSRGIVLVASGEASVQKMRASYKPQQGDAMEEEAMVHAVRSAHDSLAQFLARQ